MFALLAPAGFALIVSVKKRLDAHAQYEAVQRRAKAAAALRGAAAGALPDAEVDLWRQRAMLATERIKGLETVITVRCSAAGEERGDRGWQKRTHRRAAARRPKAARAARVQPPEEAGGAAARLRDARLRESRL